MKLTEEKKEEILGRSRTYIAMIRLGVAGDYIRLREHQRLADTLGIDPRDKRLLAIIHHLELPIEPSYEGDPREKTFFTHPDRNLTDNEVMEKYGRLLYDKLIKEFGE